MAVDWTQERAILEQQVIALINKASHAKLDQAMLDHIAVLQSFRRRLALCEDADQFELLAAEWDQQEEQGAAYDVEMV